MYVTVVSIKKTEATVELEDVQHHVIVPSAVHLRTSRHTIIVTQSPHLHMSSKRALARKPIELSPTQQTIPTP